MKRPAAHLFHHLGQVVADASSAQYHHVLDRLGAAADVAEKLGDGEQIRRNVDTVSGLDDEIAAGDDDLALPLYGAVKHLGQVGVTGGQLL